MIAQTQNGQKPVPGAPVSSNQMFENRSPFQTGVSPLFHMIASDNSASAMAITVSAIRIGYPPIDRKFGACACLVTVSEAPPPRWGEGDRQTP